MKTRYSKIYLFLWMCAGQIFSSKKRLFFKIISISMTCVIFLCASFVIDSYLRSLYAQNENFSKNAVLVSGDIPDWLYDEIRIRFPNSRAMNFRFLEATNDRLYTSNDQSMILAPHVIATGVEPFSTPVIVSEDNMIMDLRITEGRDISKDDYEAKERVVVISDWLSSLLYGENTAIGQTLDLVLNSDGYQEIFTVVGVYTSKKEGLQTKEDTSNQTDYHIEYLFIPESALRYDSMMLMSPKTVISSDDANESETIRILITENTKMDAKTYYSNIRNLKSINSGVRSTLDLSLAAIVIITGISLLNNLVFSVQERSSEIGIKKAVGAKGVDICIQFFTEGILVGIIGFFAGVIASILIMMFTQIGMLFFPSNYLPIYIDNTIIAKVFFVILLQSIFFNIIPALYASRIKVIDAIRFD